MYVNAIKKVKVSIKKASLTEVLFAMSTLQPVFYKEGDDWIRLDYNNIPSGWCGIASFLRNKTFGLERIK